VEGDAQPGAPLLELAMQGGRRLPQPSLAQARAHAASQLAQLPERLRALTAAEPYRVEIAPTLRELAAEVDRCV
jgi:nicotinate phosphoribosyltransferase